MPNITTISVYFQAGETYTVYVPATMANDGGFWPRKGNIKLPNGEDRELKMGFALQSEEIGMIAKTHPDKVAIDYKHKYPLENIIWFYAATGELVRIMVANVPVHDHSSIPTGGPAYGTYFSDYKTDEEE